MIDISGRMYDVPAEYATQISRTAQCIYELMDNCDIVLEMMGEDRENKVKYFNDMMSLYWDDIEETDVSTPEGYAEYKRKNNFIHILYSTTLGTYIRKYNQKGH